MKFCKHFTCPAKVIAIYAHCEDFEYDKAPEIVSKLDDCVSIDQLEKLDLPKILCKQDFTVIFDQNCQKTHNLKLLCWINIPNLGFEKV